MTKWFLFLIITDRFEHLSCVPPGVWQARWATSPNIKNSIKAHKNTITLFPMWSISNFIGESWNILQNAPEFTILKLLLRHKEIENKVAQTTYVQSEKYTHVWASWMIVRVGKSQELETVYLWQHQLVDSLHNAYSRQSRYFYTLGCTQSIIFSANNCSHALYFCSCRPLLNVSSDTLSW